MTNCMFLYNFASWMLEILCLEYVVDDPLGCRNPRNSLKWKLCSKQGRMGFCQAPCVRGDGPVYAALTLRMQGWPWGRVFFKKKTLIDLLKYKSSRLSVKPSPTYFQPRKPFFEVPQWQKTFHLMSRLRLGGLVPISRIPSPPMVFLMSSHTIK